MIMISSNRGGFRPRERGP